MASVPVPDSNLQKALLKVVQGSGVPPDLKFHYNPGEYTVSRTAQWNRPPTNGAESAPPAQFASPSPGTIQMEIFFDAFEEPGADVTRAIETLMTWTKPCPPSVANGIPQPPVLAFHWGANPTLPEFQGYLKSVSVRYTMFRPDGTAVRASANITLEEAPRETPGQNPTSGSRLGRRSHLVVEGDSLHSIAFAEYGVARYWRGLAAFNDIDDPLRLATGQRLLIPTPAEAARLS